jgi:GTP diphosphokinase / guanosine-3',5'-bis(diphosphate) 3'-diphosphatase
MLKIDDVLKNLRVSLTPEREALIRSAFEFAESAHRGQKRKSGEDYIQHPLGTAVNLARIGMGSKTIAAGLLHDVPEDTEVTTKELEQKFGKEISFIVSGITKLGKIKLRETKEELYLENLRKMFLAMASDIRVVLIKLADRLNNMETLDILPEPKQKRIALETIEVFVPIANRLGIGELKSKLEDLSFKYLEPENYEYTKKVREEVFGERKKNVEKSVQELKKELLKDGIKVIEIYGRVKSLYSLFQKLKKHEMDINKVYDLAGIRIIVPEVADCYEALGIVHKKYHPLVGRIKDYISLPKPNGYQSIHTTIFGLEGKILEVQIRTKRMHDEAEFGIAAHWVYSEERKDWKEIFFKKKNKFPEEELLWVKQLREWQNEIGKDNQEFLESLKIDFFKNHIFAFTPRGDVIDLPEEATPIDFAYKVHSEIGNRALGAKADGKMVPLDYKIKNGEMIEIIVSKDNKSPSQDWLRFVRTTLAKSQIKKAEKKKNLA